MSFIILERKNYMINMVKRMLIMNLSDLNKTFGDVYSLSVLYKFYMLNYKWLRNKSDDDYYLIYSRIERMIQDG